MTELTKGELKIIENKKDGNVYKNIYPKGKTVETEDGIIEEPGLNHQEYVPIKKKYDEGRQIPNNFENGPDFNYIVGAEYDGEDVSFFLKPHQHDKYVQTGIVGDIIWLTAEKKKNNNDGGGKFYKELSFQLPEGEDNPEPAEM